jgi:hypothetical protein
VTFNVPRISVLVGTNNAGKTNILRAIHLFFCCHPGAITNKRVHYARRDDFPRFVDAGRTTIQLIFRADNNSADGDVLAAYNRIKRMLGITSGDPAVLSILLTFSEAGKPAYQIFPNSKRPTSSTELTALTDEIERFFEIFFQNFAIHYLPSDKHFDEIYRDLILPSVKVEIAESLSGVYETVKNSISSVNTLLNKFMSEIGLSTFAIRLA